MSEYTKGLIFVSITAIFWAFLAIALKAGSYFLDSVTIVWFRFFFASSVMAIFLLINQKGKLQVFKGVPYENVLSGLFLGINYLCFMKGVELTSPSVTQILIQVGPISLAIVGFVYFKEEVNKKQLIGFVLALIGFITFYQDQLASITVSKQMAIGSTWVFTGGISWTLYAVFQKKANSKISVNESNLIIYLVASLMFVGFSDFDALKNLPSHNWPLLVFFGANTLIAYGCLAAALKRIPANQASIIITLNPLVTILIMGILSKNNITWVEAEDIHTQGYIGAFFVVMGAIFVNAFKTKKRS